jgi:hypothetical protein
MERTIATLATEQEAPQEARLWQAVIVSTIEEWVSGPLRRSREAEQFLFTDNPDFLLVCQSAGMNAESLRARLTKLRKQSVARVDCQVAA